MRRIAFGVFGTGRMACRMARNLRRLEGVSLGAIGSAAPARAAAFAREIGVPASGSFAELLERSDLDAVYIATRNSEHCGLAVQALRAGIAVLCEKPAAISPEEASQIRQAATASQTLFMEAICTPFLPAFTRAVALARSQALGAPTYLSADFGVPVSAGSHPGIFRIAGGGVLLDRLVYPLVLGLELFGPVRKALSSVVTDETGIDVEASLLINHERGPRSVLSVSLRSLSSNSATIACERGRIDLAAPITSPECLRISRVAAERAQALGKMTGEIRDRLRGLSILRRIHAVRGITRERRSYGEDPYVAELTHFCRLLRDGRTESDVIPLSMTQAVQDVIAQARASTLKSAEMPLAIAH